jgi:hypothetical protein
MKLKNTSFCEKILKSFTNGFQRFVIFTSGF